MYFYKEKFKMLYVFKSISLKKKRAVLVFTAVPDTRKLTQWWISFSKPFPVFLAQPQTGVMENTGFPITTTDLGSP